jgi:hypothetical protein
MSLTFTTFGDEPAIHLADTVEIRGRYVRAFDLRVRAPSIDVSGTLTN